MGNQSFAISQFDIKYLTTKNGLSNNYVTCVCEDEKGFIWIGTRDGLNRWDGYQFKVFKNQVGDTNSLPDNFIRSIASDKKGNIWIGTNQSGIVQFSLREERFYTYPVDYTNSDAFPDFYVRCILVQNDKIWFGTNSGLVKYVPKKDAFKRIFLTDTTKKNNSRETILSIFKIDAETIGVQSNIGIFKMSTNKPEKLILPNDIANKSSLYESNPIFYTKNGTLWFADPDELFLYIPKVQKTYRFKHKPEDENSISSTDVSGIFQDSKQNIWVATWNAGINLFNPESNTFSSIIDDDTKQIKLSNNIVTSVFEDSYNNLWITTEEGGINYFTLKKNRIQYYGHDPFNKNSLSDNKVGSFYFDNNETVWIGTENGGLNKLSIKQDVFKLFDISNQITFSNILGIAKASEKEFYLTGWGLGLYKFNKYTGRAINVLSNIKGLDYTNKSLINVKSFCVDTEGYVWLATHSINGITIYDPYKNSVYNSTNPGPFNSDILSVSYPASILQDMQGRIWVSSYSGLFMYDGKYREFQSDENTSSSISSNYILSMHEDKRGSLWIGTSKGLDKITINKNGITVEQLKLKNNQLPENIKSIITDNKDNIWLSSGKGITRFNYKTNQSKDFQVSNSAIVYEFSENACLKTKNGELFFGTTNGFYRFHPDSLEKTSNEPTIYFTDFKIQNKSLVVGEKNSPLKKTLLETDTIILKYNQSSIGIEFAALDINSHKNTEYAYKMDGVDNNWVYSGNNRNTNYANLAPGKYNFRVRTVNAEKLNEMYEAGLYIIVRPPLWLTKIAYGIYALLALLALYLFRKAILNREKLKNALKLEKLKIQNVQETNLMKLRFFTNISHEFRTPLTLIKVPIEKLLKKNSQLSDNEREYHYKLMMNSANKLDKMVSQLMDYRKLEAGGFVLEAFTGDIVDFCQNVFESFKDLAIQKKLNFVFETKVDKHFMAFDSDKLEKVLSNLLSNAFKNTPSPGTIKLIISDKLLETEGKITITISDSGYGIAEKDLPHIFERFYRVQSDKVKTVQGTGIGLALAKELIEIHNGTLHAKSTENKGSDFIIQLPINILVKEAEEKYEEPTKEIEVELHNFDSEKDENADKSCILLIDDDEELLQFITKELSSIYRVITAPNGEIGIQKAIEHKPDLIISDVMMTKVDGIELCKQLKENELTSHIPIILVTARYSQEKEIEGLDSGANAYITKPFNLDVFHLTISNILVGRKKLIERFKTDSSLDFESEDIESSDKKLMQKVITLVLENITNNKINADFISKRVFISRTLLYMKIEALTGQTVNEFVSSIRLKKAKSLLLSPENNITEVAFAVGFSSQSYFSRSFAKQFGQSPKEYKEHNQKE